jgi:hypothetical protein
MDNLEKKQLPFAMSLSLNKIALMAQEHICTRIPVIFNNSKKWWDRHQKTGMKVSFSSKYALVSSVYTIAYFAAIQEDGGVKKPHNGGLIAVPTMHVPKRQRSSGVLRREQGNKNIFKLGRSIYKRISNQKLQKLYSLTSSAKVKPRFGFKRMAINIFNTRFDAVFTKQFNYALDTAKW